MSISKESELVGMMKIGKIVATTLKAMQTYAKPGMTTKELDDFGAEILQTYGARSAPALSYGFPGCTCISVNNEVAHGIPSAERVLQEGDLVNIDVSAELNGFWADNGSSFILGKDIHKKMHLIYTSKRILQMAINRIRGGVRIADIGEVMEREAKKEGYKVIKNLAGHGIGKSLHEEPDNILNYKDRFDRRRFKKNSVVAIETFIATDSTLAVEQPDGWTLVGNKGGYAVQHEHTIVVTDGKPLILTAENGVWD